MSIFFFFFFGGGVLDFFIFLDVICMERHAGGGGMGGPEAIKATKGAARSEELCEEWEECTIYKLMEQRTT